MNLSDTPFAEKKFTTVDGQRMAYIDEGEGGVGQSTVSKITT
jgi:haloalkane dehalogenase